jgi:hypothetical protein
VKNSRKCSPLRVEKEQGNDYKSSKLSVCGHVCVSVDRGYRARGIWDGLTVNV